jgi:hypothetical protein
VVFVEREGEATELPLMSKTAVADAVLARVEGLLRDS